MPRIIVRLAFAMLGVMLLAALVALSRSHVADGEGDRPYRVSLPDLSSPRATLETLNTNGDVALREVIANGVPWAPSPAMRRMMDTMNVDDVPAAGRQLAAGLAASVLKEVLGHIALPAPADIPDAAAVKRDNITEWQLPGTPIVIAKVASGPHAGRFEFSPQTVALADAIHDAVRVIPYKTGPHANVYAEWRYMPGPLLPREVIAALPAPLRAPVLGQAVWQWIGLVLLLGTSSIVLLQTIGWSVRHDMAAESVGRRFGQLLAATMVAALSMVDLGLIEFALKIWGTPLEVLQFALQLVAIGGVAWLLVVFILRAGELIITALGMSGTNLDGQLIKVISTLLSIFAGLAAGFFAADFVGIPIGPLLAGLGIGGLAVALAVRPTLENVIGGLTLFADRPARVGEFCRIGSEYGTVEEIGLRTTKIRRTDDTVVTISNSELAQTRIENFSRRRKFLFDPKLLLVRSTTAEQLREIATGVEALLEQHQKVLEGTVRVRFTSFGDYALELELRAYVDVTRSSEFGVVREELNFAILDIIRRSGTALALPSQTMYVAREMRGVPAEVAGAGLGAPVASVGDRAGHLEGAVPDHPGGNHQHDD